VKNVTLLELLE